ncbi:iron ABC transporter permease [Mycetocola tolaasinivorans]|uniref:Iron ABC transporter permease n=1 Tax=Mycetocola tolaasinivorans TaxID=76635 RepID=A0A3L7A5B6_9MICO|nr:iron ABC transporter permease [Mycetocola tolaasinivorans]RLP74512.1 iron ABC transporter permease [Mycetocola tolaasinivorans]
MPSERKRNLTWVLTGGGVLLIILVILSFAIGSHVIPFGTLFRAATAYDRTDNDHVILAHLRFPRTVIGILAGCALGVAGAAMQALTRNPLAEPGLLGINSGAAAGVVTGLVFFPALSSFGGILLAFAGAAAAAVLVFTLGGALRTPSNPVRLVLAGAASAAILGAYTSALLLNVPTAFTSFRAWDAGSLQGRPWDAILAPALAIIAGLILALLLGRSLNAAALGQDLSRAVGASPMRITLLTGTCIVLLAGGATAAAGPISFVGLAAPMLARTLVGPDHRWLLPTAMILSADLLLAADILGRLILWPSELQAAIVMALIGAPVFILIVRRRKLVQL